MQEKKYKSLGYCIMCLDTAYPRRELTVEHIIPDAIGGTLLFIGGVCRQCAQEQNRAFEQPSLRTDLLIPRLLIKLRAKPPGDPLPPVAILNPDQSIEDAEFNRILPFEMYPKLLHFTYYRSPGKLRGVDEGTGIREIGALTVNISKWYPDGINYYESPLVTQQTHTSLALPLSVVKMAYCFAVGEKGLECFDGSEVRDLLQGRRDDALNFFGGTEAVLRARRRKIKTGRPLHHISLSIYPGRILVGKVDLFASYGGPEYLVVLGRIK
jgi:hypothetical protein